MAIALKAENVAIRYVTGDFKDIGLKEYTVRRLTGNYHVKEFMAVDGISFELKEGDMLGIIGSNGAGKSTLLKAVAGIMEPTRGRITVNGDIAALLELGSGFDGDLTVKENAYLRGAMLGYTKEFMDQTYNQIIEFAELKEFEDRPFKQLSSGMKSRLAFSIASLVKPDILILDEVLSVGDGAFQEKSAKKMREIISQGATTILVSHSLDQIRELCNKVLWLDHGRQVAFGGTQEICDQYDRFLRGECPAEMYAEPKAEQPLISKEDNVSPVKDDGIKRRNGIKRIICSLVLALFCAAFAFRLGQQFFVNKLISHVEITEKVGSGEVAFRGGSVDGVWINATDHVVEDGGWIYDSEQAMYTAATGETLVFDLPAGNERALTFNVGPDAGVVLVDIDGTHLELNLWNENVVELGLPYGVPGFSTQSALKQVQVLVSLVFIAVFILCFALYWKQSRTTAGEREVWLDILRIFCCLVIVLLHCTCNVYKQFGEDLYQWYPHMLMSCFTAFSVPCFYMISGAGLLRREHGIREIWLRRIPKSMVPLLFWSVLYILISGDIQPYRFIAMIFQAQWPHLWFMYCIVAIYALLPILSRLYVVLSIKVKFYLLLILLFVPSCLHDVQYLLNAYVDMPRFAIFWPDLGLFFWGAFLWEQRERLVKWAKWYPLSFAAGLALTAACTVYTSFRDGTPNPNFISCIGSMGVLMMCSSLFCICLVHRERLQRLNIRLKKILASIGAVSFGVYLMHPLLMELCGSWWSNDGNFAHMAAAGVIYFAFSVMICLCAKQMRVIEKLI